MQPILSGQVPPALPDNIINTRQAPRYPPKSPPACTILHGDGGMEPASHTLAQILTGSKMSGKMSGVRSPPTRNSVRTIGQRRHRVRVLARFRRGRLSHLPLMIFELAGIAVRCRFVPQSASPLRPGARRSVALARHLSRALCSHGFPRGPQLLSPSRRTCVSSTNLS